ncbi:MAG: CoA transferase [Candidatus Rokubacteria bacterium]|nr:CoA transferase [Candidatus Rokubacteria bacterium]
MRIAWPEWIRALGDPARAFAKDEALADLLVVDCSRASMAGLVASSFLAELGAEVIRIEPPGGDPARYFTPFGLLHQDTGLGYLVEGRNKFHVTLSLESEEGREILGTLARRADVLIETFLPGQMDAWGLGYRQLSIANSRLIYCALYTYGQFGPRAACGQPNADMADQALSGVTFITGFPPGTDPGAVPTRQGNWHGWTLGGLWGAFGILVAVHARSITGAGQFVDVSPAEALMRSADISAAWWDLDGILRSRMGNYDTAIFPYTYVRCKDGYLLLAAVMEPAWQALCRLMARTDLAEQYPTIPSRRPLEVQRALHKEVEARTATLTFEEIAERFEAGNRSLEGGVMVAGRVVDLRQVIQNEHYRARGALAVFSDPTYGDLLIQLPFQKLSASPPRLKWACRRPGQDNAHIYAEYLGYGREALARLRARGTI